MKWQHGSVLTFSLLQFETLKYSSKWITNSYTIHPNSHEISENPLLPILKLISPESDTKVKVVTSSLLPIFQLISPESDKKLR